MHILHIHLRVKPERLDDFLAASLVNAHASLKEPGCKRFDIVQEAGDPSRIEFVEVYRDQAAHSAHRESPHYKAWSAAVADHFTEPRTRTLYRNFFPADSAF